MGIRPIEMQMSIPRSQDANAVSHQAQHKPLIDQTQLADQASKLIVELRHRNTKVDESVQLPIREQFGRQQQSSKQNKPAKEREGGSEQSEVPIHPYLGHRFDRSL